MTDLIIVPTMRFSSFQERASLKTRIRRKVRSTDSEPLTSAHVGGSRGGGGGRGGRGGRQRDAPPGECARRHSRWRGCRSASRSAAAAAARLQRLRPLLLQQRLFLRRAAGTRRWRWARG